MTAHAELIQTLASALGVEHEVVADYASHLREAELFPGGDAQPEHAAALLMALMSGATPDKAPGAVRLYGGLPLESACRGRTRPDGIYESGTVPNGDPLIENVKTWGSHFAEALAALIASFNETPEIDYKVINFEMGGGPGTARAAIHFAPLTEGEEVMGNMTFSLIPLGGGVLPDDAPRARLERQAVVPGAILPILRECFTGDTGGPREVLCRVPQRFGEVDYARIS